MADPTTPAAPPRPVRPGQKLGRIAMVLDDRLSREKNALLTRIVNGMRQFAEIQLLPGYTTEENLLKKLEETPFQLILAPWYRYLSWSKVEALYGLTRTSGPTFAGYHCEPLLPYEIGEQADHLRAIMLEFGNLSAREAGLLIRTLLQDTRRSGIRPLLAPNTPVYCEHWYSGQGLGNRFDAVLSLPDVTSSGWHKRSGAIRICLSSLWSLIYEEGPGKADYSQGIVSKTPRAAFQLAADAGLLVMRLCYPLPPISPKEVLHNFWPDSKQPTAAAQLLLRYADFVRVHHIAEGSYLEVIACLLPSSPSERAPSDVHTLWVEPLAPNLMVEVPFEMPGPSAPFLRPLPAVAPVTTGPRYDEEANPPAAPGAKDRFVLDAAAKIRELKGLLAERETMIDQLRSGGVGTAAPLPPPDAEALLDAFQERYFEARYQIRQFEIQISELEKKGGTPGEVAILRKKMEALGEREQVWIKKLARTIQLFRESREAREKGTKKP